MQIEKGLNPNCSEAVFRFYTLEPKKIQEILQIIADKVAEQGYNKMMKIPLFKTAEEYDTKYMKAPDSAWEEHFKKTSQLSKDMDSGKLTQGEYDRLYRKEQAKLRKLEYPKGTLLSACAGLGDNEAVVTIEKKKGAFRLNIGNNDLVGGDMGWVGAIKTLGIKVEETATNKELEQYARDCTCGITFGF